MKYNNKIQIGLLLRNYRLNDGFYVKDKKGYIITMVTITERIYKKFYQTFSSSHGMGTNHLLLLSGLVAKRQ